VRELSAVSQLLGMLQLIYKYAQAKTYAYTYTHRQNGDDYMKFVSYVPSITKSSKEACHFTAE
jgi:hypothetical protein